jgi:hypothetical protein
LQGDDADKKRITLPVPASEDDYVSNAYASAVAADAMRRPTPNEVRRHSSGLRFSKAGPPSSGTFSSSDRAATETKPPVSGERELAEPGVDRVARLYREGELARCLMLAEHLLASGDGDRDGLELHAALARDAMVASYRQRLGGGGALYRSTRGPDALRTSCVDAHMAFLLSLIDGRSTVDEIVDMSGMAPLDAIRSLHELLQEELIAECDGPGRGDRRSR